MAKRAARGKKRIGPEKPARSRKSPGEVAKARNAPGAVIQVDANDRALRDHLADLFGKGNAHADWRDILNGIPEALRGVKPARAPHSAWQLLEHLRIAQWDILEFSRNPKHVSPQFPLGYWPATEMPPSVTAWETSVKAFERDLAEMRELVSHPKTDLFARIPHGDGQTILREALVLADHNAYHLGQIVLLRRMLGAWTASY
ncbi:MAG TPA: DinB family protein [Candidatus Acidoferrales bacterium]|nr:DinB family protein [Candidatus Acidoferrales bacterium]